MEHKKHKKWKFLDWGRPHRKLENWGRRKIVDKKTKNLFSGVGIAAVTAVFVMGVFAAVLILSNFLRQAIETKISQNLVVNIQHQMQNQPNQAPAATTTSLPSASGAREATTQTTTPVQPLPPVVTGTPSDLLYTSFTDLFSGMGWLNSGATTMYRDDNETAFMFPPKFGWVPSGPQTLGAPSVPRGVMTKVVQDGNTYKVLVYAPDGSEILSETSTPIVSKYQGQVGIGGTQNDFVVVYGAYWGAGARIVNINGSWQVQDLSQFFGIRPMNNGFQPEIIKVSSTFYVYSGTDGNPKLIKLFTNGTGQIQGAVDFSESLFSHAEKSAAFAVENGAPVGAPLSLVTKIVDSSGNASYYQFTDEGFDKSQPLQIVSANLSNYPGTIYSATLTNTGLSSGGGNVSFFFSNDGSNWLPAAQGQAINFPTDKQPLYWKAVFTPSGDNFSSPWFDTIGVSYTVKY